MTEENPCVPTTASDDQMTISGRVAAGVDRGDNVFHVGYVQTPAFVAGGNHTDGDVVLSTRLYTECQ